MSPLKCINGKALCIMLYSITHPSFIITIAPRFHCGTLSRGVGIWNNNEKGCSYSNHLRLYDIIDYETKISNCLLLYFVCASYLNTTNRHVCNRVRNQTECSTVILLWSGKLKFIQYYRESQVDRTVWISIITVPTIGWPKACWYTVIFYCVFH